MAFSLNQMEELKDDTAYRVYSINWKGHYKRLSLKANEESEDEGKIFFNVPLSSCVTKDDIIYKKECKIFVKCKNRDVQIFPLFNKKRMVKIGALEIKTHIKEITEASEYQEYKSLSKYHYRDKDMFGRTARLIIKCNDSQLPTILGYIELASPFYMNKPRSILFNNNFKLNGIEWESWDQDTKKKFVNLIVRISRVVVHPEFRGVGLGQILVKNAEYFSKFRWQLGNYAPYFLEISADMLKYVSFAPKAGMHFIGKTEGNLHRVAKDMAYLTSNVDRVRSGEIVQEASHGIVDQQVARMEKFIDLMNELDISKDELITKLEKLQVEDILKDYALFHDVISLPKPTYMKGLNKYSENFIKRSLSGIKTSSNNKSNFISKKIGSPIEVEELTLTYTSKVRRTKTTHAIQQAFGISPNLIDNKIVEGLSFSFDPGKIILLTGPSGSGKTSLLNYLNGKKRDNLKIDGQITYPEEARIGSFEKIKSQKALIEYFNDGNINQAINLLSAVGLSDAYTFLKRYNELSKGQQFRAKLAKIINENYNVWLVDEFCTNLDEITANVVSDKIQQISRDLGVIVIVAAANYKHFIRSLKPDKVLHLHSAWHHNIINGDKFIKGLEKSFKY